MRISLSPDPGVLSQKARLVTGPVCPLKRCSVFPDFRPVRYNHPFFIDERRAQTSKSSRRTAVVFSAIQATPSLISIANAFPRSSMGSPSVFVRSALFFLAYIQTDWCAVKVSDDLVPTSSMASWASVTMKLSVLMLKLDVNRCRVCKFAILLWRRDLI